MRHQGSILGIRKLPWGRSLAYRRGVRPSSWAPAVPVFAVARLQHPVPLVGEVDEALRHAPRNNAMADFTLSVAPFGATARPPRQPRQH
jgi:hypothetical protein